MAADSADGIFNRRVNLILDRTILRKTTGHAHLLIAPRGTRIVAQIRPRRSQSPSDDVRIQAAATGAMTDAGIGRLRRGRRRMLRDESRPSGIGTR